MLFFVFSVFKSSIWLIKNIIALDLNINKNNIIPPKFAIIVNLENTYFISCLITLNQKVKVLIYNK